jgi:SAM-dependent methyltransferase
LFEEANGADGIFFDLLPESVSTVGSDVARSTVARARERCSNQTTRFCVCDASSSAIRPESLDAVISTSTLDHFETQHELEAALAELLRVLRPGGVLVVTLDNPRNPLYRVLRWYSRTRFAPFRLGKTLSQAELRRTLERVGADVIAEDVLIHNPRLLSTAVFLLIRGVLGRHADPVIRWLLRAFGGLAALPTRGLTACFIAACAVKRAAPASH